MAYINDLKLKIRHILNEVSEASSNKNSQLATLPIDKHQKVCNLLAELIKVQDVLSIPN